MLLTKTEGEALLFLLTVPQEGGPARTFRGWVVEAETVFKMHVPGDLAASLLFDPLGPLPRGSRLPSFPGSSGPVVAPTLALT